jgi:hypothetical protein
MKRTIELIILRPVLGTWRLCCAVVTFFASAADIPETEKDGYLTGVFNFRTRKFDDGTDPRGWYEDDL